VEVTDKRVSCHNERRGEERRGDKALFKSNGRAVRGGCPVHRDAESDFLSQRKIIAMLLSLNLPSTPTDGHTYTQ
jgi:hypothetical protein